MPIEVDEYVRGVIGKGDAGSKEADVICAPTLANRSGGNLYVRIIGPEKTRALHFPTGQQVIGHSSAGHGSELEQAASSMVDKLIEQAREIGATPVAFTNIIDSRTGDLGMIRRVCETLVQKANANGLVIINGENAILGDIVDGDANVSGTMISIAPERSRVYGGVLPAHETFRKHSHGPIFATFNPRGRYVTANCDGIGTKTRLYQRKGEWAPSVNDFIAMVADDAAKIRRAKVEVISGVLEVSGNSDQIAPTMEMMRSRCADMNVLGTLQVETGKLNAFKKGEIAYNIGGTAIGTVTEEDLSNPFIPQSEDYVIAIRGKPNPRSNGITSRREAMVKLLGENWHETPMGRHFLEFLAQPSTVLYPVFRDLVEAGLATGVFHMSGGAYKGKLARPLAKNGLRAELDNLFHPDWREIALVETSGTSAEAAYGKFAMGNEGFVTTSRANHIAVLERMAGIGLDARVAGEITNTGTGVVLTAYNGENVSYSGKN